MRCFWKACNKNDTWNTPYPRVQPLLRAQKNKNSIFLSAGSIVHSSAAPIQPEEKEEEEEEEKQREEKGEKARDIIHPLLCDMHLRQHSSTGPHLGHIWATPGIPNHGFSVHLKSNHGSNHGFQIVPGGKSST